MKRKSDVAGFYGACPDYEPCPLCYGCRNYDAGYSVCNEMCGRNIKKNTCSRKKHGADKLALFITKEKVKL